ncbi:MAG: TRAP transporter small permease subunit [Myxococcota bacterium]|nr:TRAP transporter small permease subunit [Myxococcota bacterium]MDW8361412.1 TRAP transporter small permease subunit [Myxococcales bacterium]
MLRRVDDGLARGEAAIAAAVLLVMIVLAATQALLHNVATGLGVAWAHAALESLDWIDTFLQKGTLWLAFLGASLATHADRHIAIDVVQRVVPPRVRLVLRVLAAFGAAAVAFVLARVFFATVMLAATERPLDYEVLTPAGAVHVCDASEADRAAAGAGRPGPFCVVRALLAGLVGGPVETPSGALQLVVPAMFLWMSVRLLMRGIVEVRRGIAGSADGGMA